MVDAARTMLLIEDDDVDAEAVRRALHDWDVTHVETLRAGIHALMSAHFSAVAVDLHLPDGGPDEVVPRVLAAAAGIAPVIVLTGLRDEARALEFVASGADDFVQKGAADQAALRRQLMFAVERYRRNAASTRWRTRLAQWAHEGDLRWVWRIDAGTLEGNDAWHAAVQQQSGGAPWDAWVARVHPTERDAVLDALTRVSSGDVPAWEISLRVMCADAGFVRGSLHVTAMWNPSGTPTVVRGSLRVAEADGDDICCSCGRQLGEESAPCSACPSKAESTRCVPQHSAPVRAQLTIANRYVVESKIASGSSGVVYRVRDETDERPAALKLLHAHLAQDMTARSRFSREAQLQRELSHPNILPVLDYGSHDGSPFLVLPLVSGGSMTQHLAQYGPFPVEEVLGYGAALADALAAAHVAGVVHRDVKPGNVLLEYAGDRATVLLTDFGIAKPLLESSGTLTGSVLGTLQYLAPEQLEDSTKVTHLADQYSLGATLFEMLVGAPPDWKQVFGQGQPVGSDPRLADHPKELAAIIQRSMSFDAGDRYSSCDAVAATLRSLISLDVEEAETP